MQRHDTKGAVMKYRQSRRDGGFLTCLGVVVALLAFGLQVSVFEGFVLDRGSHQARAGDEARAASMAAAASEASRSKESRGPLRRR